MHIYRTANSNALTQELPLIGQILQVNKAWKQSQEDMWKFSFL